MSETRAVLFHRSAPPYEAGDVAGFPLTLAQSFVDRRIATFHAFEADEPETATDDTAALDDAFSVMDRASLLAYGKEKLGMTDEPPAEVTDDQLRAALREAAAKSTKKKRQG